MIGQDTTKTGYIDQWEGRRPVLPNMEVVDIEDSSAAAGWWCGGGWETGGESDSQILAVMGCQENRLHSSQ